MIMTALRGDKIEFFYSDIKFLRAVIMRLIARFAEIVV